MKRFNKLFIICVLVPTLFSIIYFGIIASDVYISESRFVVRSPDKQSFTGLGVLLKGASFGNAGDEVNAVHDFAGSRDALVALNKNRGFEKSYSRPEIDIFDRFGVFGFQKSVEDLYKYYSTVVSVETDSSTSITVLKVKAFDTESAYAINERLLELSEGLVNQLNRRGHDDLVMFAQREVSDTEARSQAAAVDLAAYRNKQGLLDPEKQAAIQSQLISKLQDELIASQTQLLELRAFTPQNSQIDVLNERVKGLRQAIVDETAKIAGSSRSLAGVAAQYQRLVLASQFADKELAGALSSLETARNEAHRKQVYVERIVQPNKPDAAVEPRRIRGIVSTFLLGLVAWGILTMLLAGLKEHQD